MDGCSLVGELPQYTPPCPSAQEWKVGIFFHGALAHPEADRWHSPMVDVEAAWKLVSGRIRH